MKGTWIAICMIALFPFLANAATRSEILKQVESSLLVKGTIETNADGSVSSTTIDEPEKLPKGVVAFVQQQAATWKFEPVLIDGKARLVRSPMSVRVVARKVDENNYSIGIRNASFGGEDPKEGETLASTKLAPPRYPQGVAMHGASGAVYVVVKVGRDGRVNDAIAEQVNLKTIGTVSQMASWRKALTDAALKAAQAWTFNIPVKGEQAGAEFWSARVPVDFIMNSKFQRAYGKWEVYIPGPRQTIPWTDEDRPGFSPDSLAEGGVYMLGQNKGPKLLTRLDKT